MCIIPPPYQYFTRSVLVASNHGAFYGGLCNTAKDRRRRFMLVHEQETEALRKENGPTSDPKDVSQGPLIESLVREHSHAKAA